MKELAELHDSTGEMRNMNGNAASGPPSKPEDAIKTFAQGISSLFSGSSQKGSSAQGNNQLSPTTTLTSEATMVNSGSQDISRLLLCIDSGFAATPLYQERLGYVSTDRQLFSFLRSEYFRHWNVKPWLSLRSLESVCLTRVGILQCFRIRILQEETDEISVCCGFE